MNKYGEAVKCDFDLTIAYDISLIEMLKVFNFSTKEWDTCEYWGSEKEYYFGRMADFNFDISKAETRIYYGECPYYGYFSNSPSQLVILPVAAFSPKGFICKGLIKIDQKYPVPETMLDLAKHIDNFIYCRLKMEMELQKEHDHEQYQEIQERIQMAVQIPDEFINELNDLPF